VYDLGRKVTGLPPVRLTLESLEDAGSGPSGHFRRRGSVGRAGEEVVGLGWTLLMLRQFPRRRRCLSNFRQGRTREDFWDTGSELAGSDHRSLVLDLREG